MTILLSLLLAVQPAPAAAPAPAQVRTFGDWAVTCDNGRTCQAVALMAEAGDWERFASLFVERGPAPGATTTYRFSDGKEAPARLAVDGAALPARILIREPEVVVEPAEPAAFRRALLAGRQLQLQAANGETLRTTSLTGLTAALLYMDEQQRRPAAPGPERLPPGGAPIRM